MEQKGLWGVNHKFPLFGASLLQKCSLFAGDNGLRGLDRRFPFFGASLLQKCLLFAGDNGLARQREGMAQTPGGFPRAGFFV